MHLTVTKKRAKKNMTESVNERLNDPGHSILVRKSYNFARYLNLTFTDLENIANLLFKN
jgi:hypothetical protein